MFFFFPVDIIPTMLPITRWLVLTVVVWTGLMNLGIAPTDAKNTDLEEAQAFLDEYNEQAMVVYYQSALASWVYNTNITDYNQAKDVSYKFNILRGHHA